MEDVSGVGNWQEVGGEIESQAGPKNGAGGGILSTFQALGSTCWSQLTAAGRFSELGHAQTCFFAESLWQPWER